MTDRPNKITKTAEFLRQCRLVAAGLDDGDHMDAIAARVGVSSRHVYRIRDDFRDLGWPRVSATQLASERLDP